MIGEKIEDLNMPSVKSMEVQRLNFCSCPGCFPQKTQAGFDAWIILETADADALAQFGPAIMLQKALQNDLKGESVKGIVGLFSHFNRRYLLPQGTAKRFNDSPFRQIFQKNLSALQLFPGNLY